MENTTVFIGNLDFGVTEEEIKTLLSDYGTVVNIRMRKKKGYTFVEMSSEAEAALAIEKLNGVMYKDREIRISLEMKTKKAKSATIRNYNERAERFSGHKTDSRPKRDYQGDRSESRPPRREWSPDRPPRDGERSGYGRPQKREPGFNSRERSYGSRQEKIYRGESSSRPPRREWSPDRQPRDGERSGYGRPQKREPGFNSRERSYGSRQEKIYRGESSSRPPRREWSPDRPPRDGERSGYGRPQKREAGFNSRERSYGSRQEKIYRGESSSRPPRREWSSDRPPRDRERSGYGRLLKNESGFNSREKSSDPKPRRSPGNRDRNSRRDRE